MRTLVICEKQNADLPLMWGPSWGDGIRFLAPPKRAAINPDSPRPLLPVSDTRQPRIAQGH